MSATTVRSLFVPAILVMLAAALAPRPAEAQTIATHDFTTGSANGYTFDAPSGGVVWKVGAPPSVFGTTPCLNCNNGTDYQWDTALISATSPWIDPAGQTSLTIQVECAFETETERPGQENNFDVRWMTVTQGTTTTFFQFLNPVGPLIPLSPGDSITVCGSADTWHSHSIAVTLSSTAPFRIAFGFWDIDGSFNAHPGWAIRRVKVLGSGGGLGGGGGGGSTSIYGPGWTNPTSSPTNSSGCGLVGLDALLVLGGLRLLRRRRGRS